jgi:DNA-binding MarR family transcriptional regulator
MARTISGQYSARVPTKRARPDRGVDAGPPRPPVSCAFLLAQIGAHAGGRFAERLAAVDLQPQHAGVLRLIGASGGLSQRRLGEMLGVFPSRTVALVDELETRGLVERRDEPADRRSYALHLTERGTQALRDIGRVAREHDEAICAGLTGPEREQLMALLTRLAAQLGLTPGVHPGYRRL